MADAQAIGALAGWHARRGGIGSGGRQAPVADHGDRAAEDRALREGAAIWGLEGWSARRLVGPGRLAFLHKYVTQDVKDLRPGEGAYGCCLTVKGAMVSDLWTLAREDDALLVTTVGGGAALATHLGRYAAFAGVKLEVLDGTHALIGLAGPGADAAVASALGAVPPAGAHAHVRALRDGQDVVVARSIGPTAAVLLIAPRAIAEVLADALVAAGATPVGEAALEALRVERGAPLFGVDMDATTIPIEAGLEDRAVSLTKGCYLGQEVIARITHRGHVNRHLVGLRLPTAGITAPAELQKDGKVVGSLTSIAASARLGPVGLGLVHRKHVEPGTKLALPGGGEAVVVTLPFEG